MKVNINNLRTICNYILSEMIEKGITEIEFDVDDYWDFLDVSRYNFKQIPTEDCIVSGQLSHDIADLDSLFKDDNLPMQIDLLNVSILLRAIGDGHYCQPASKIDPSSNSKQTIE